MSNFLSIATVTATLVQLLQAGVQSDVSDASITVTAARPDTSGTDTIPTGVNLFLYQVTPNAAMRNADLPTRSSSGQVINRPRAALDLHYLLSFHGDETRLEPQRMLGSTIRILNTQPQLTRGQIITTIADPTLTFLVASDLADEIEMVRFTPATLTLDELSKIWSIFYQMPYALSIVYVASVVYIESMVSTRSAPPVQRYNTYTIPSLGPHIDRLLSQAAPNQPIVADQFVLPGYRLIVQGQRLRGDITRVSIGGVVVTPAPDAISGEQITVALPPALRPGLQGVQVLQPFDIGTPPAEHQGLESNVVPFVLHPTITASATVTASRTVDGVTLHTGKVQVTFTPKIGLRQRVVLELNQFNTPSGTIARAYTFSTRLPHPAPADSVDIENLDIAFTDVADGTYLARVQVDGAESPLTRDANGKYDGPQVDI
jgi:hypothetical protein